MSVISLSDTAPKRNPTQETIDPEILKDDLTFILSEAKALAADKETCVERKANTALRYIARLALDQQKIIEALSKRLAALEAYETVAQAEEIAYGVHEEDEAFEEVE